MRLIDADKLLDAMYEETGIMTEFRSDYETLVDEQPTVDAQPVIHAKWRKLKQPLYCELRFKCLSCKGIVNETYKFCPYCGADMGGENDGKS